MFLPLIFDDRASWAESSAVAFGTELERHRPLDETAYVRLHRLDVLGQHRLLDLRDDALEGEVDPLDLDLGRLGVEHRVELLLGELRDRLVHGQPDALEEPAVPAVHRVARHGQGSLVECLGLVVQRRQVDVADAAHALAPRSTCRRGRPRCARTFFSTRSPFSVLMTPLAVRVGTLNENAVGGPMCGLSEPAEQDPQHRVGVGGGADRGARVGAHPLLVDDDRGGQAIEEVDLGP